MEAVGTTLSAISGLEHLSPQAAVTYTDRDSFQGTDPRHYLCT
jgi:hypothetical protein